MTRDDSIWWLAIGSQEHRRQPSFAPATARPSITYSWFGFGWNREAGCFVTGSRYDLLAPPRLTEFACDRKVARAMLCLCASKRVCDRFFRNYYSNVDDADVFAAADSMFGLQLRKSARVGSNGLSEAEAQLSFYSPEGEVQTIHLHDGMTISLGKRLGGLSALQIYNAT